MKIFYKDIPLNIIKEKDQTESGLYNQVYDLRKYKPDTDELNGHVLIKKPDFQFFERLLNDLTYQDYALIKSITCSAKAFQDFKKWLKDQYTIVEAAGGLVYNPDKILMIYRHNKWDLPKGKLEKDEKPVEGAKREVQEECNIKVVLQDKICHTWHTYQQNGEDILKKTYWYRMLCRDDAQMRPQEEEDITEIKWLDKKGVQDALTNSYASIAYVMEKFEEMNF